jgi:Ca2+-binding EF-hand superfamily protein
MGAGNSLPSDIAQQCQLKPEEVKTLLKAFKEKANKKTKTIDKEGFAHVFGTVADNPRFSNKSHLFAEDREKLFDSLDVNRDGTRTASPHLLCPTAPQL